MAIKFKCDICDFERLVPQFEFNKNNISTATILKSEYEFDFNYELSDNTSILQIYNENNELIELFDNVNIGDKYTLLITDVDENTNEYYINIVS